MNRGHNACNVSIYKNILTLYVELLVKYAHFLVCFDQMYSPEKEKNRTVKRVLIRQVSELHGKRTLKKQELHVGLSFILPVPVHTAQN